MGKLRLSAALEDYDLHRALVEGYVRPKGIDLTVLVNNVSETRHERMLKHREFDICEYSVSQYLVASEKGGCGFTAIPVFTRRMFGQRFLFCRTDRGIHGPRDLLQKRVGIFRYQNTLGLWIRGYLQHEHGVPPNQIEWVRLFEEVLDCALPADVRVRPAPAGSTAENMLLSGEVDAMVVPWVPAAFHQEASLIKRVFPDVRRAETDYYRKTRDFPIMHTIVIRDEVLEQNPWVAESMREAFEESKKWYYRYASQPFRLGLAFGSLEREEQRALMGPDPWPYNVSDNRVSLDNLTQYAAEQGLTTRKLEPGTLFYRTTLKS